MNDSQVSNTPKIIGASVGAIVLVAMAAFYFVNKEHTTAQTPTLPTSSTSAPASTNTTSSSRPSSAAIKDGTYTATSRYMVPHGMNSITVRLTVAGGTVTDVQTSNSYSSGESAGYISDFKSSVSSLVVGKKLGNLSVYNVSGASDTTQGFNDALQQIETQAQA